MKILIHIIFLPLLLCPLQAELLFGEEPSEEELGDNGFEIKAHLDAIPKSMRIRCTQEYRTKALKKFGGSPNFETAVIKSLTYLQKTQNLNGSWTESQPVGMTGLALLTYLAHAETPASETFGFTTQKAITYLLKISETNQGKLAHNLEDKHWPYEHAIATHALAEAYIFCTALNLEIPNLKKAVTIAGQHIIDSQHSSGAWDYAYDQSGTRGGDASITSLHLLALKACQLTNIEFKNLDRVANKGLKYIEKCQQQDGGVYYTPSGGHLPTLTGAAILCHQQFNVPTHKLITQAARFSKNIKFDYNGPDSDLYANFFYAPAFHNLQHPHFKKYNHKLCTQLIQNQNPDGSYKPPGNGEKINAIAATYQSGSYAEVYRTCLNTLILETYYRSLPTQ